MNLKQFQYVLALANAGSFAKAADTLGISQPSLSQYVKKIEQQIGMQLFDRTGGSVRLTDAGRIYIDAGRKILALERQMMGAFNDIATHKSGSIVIGASPYRSASMMPQAARRLADEYPGMHLVVEEMTTRELADAAEHGQFDLCISIQMLNPHLFNSEKIAEEELLLAVPADYTPLPTVNMPDRKYPAVDALLLDGQRFVMITEGQFMQQALDVLAAEYRLALQKAAVVKSLEAQIAMVRAGVGMALLPSGIERFCAEGEVRFYSLQQELPKREVVAFWQKETVLTEATRKLLDILKENA